MWLYLPELLKLEFLRAVGFEVKSTKVGTALNGLEFDFYVKGCLIFFYTFEIP